MISYVANGSKRTFTREIWPISSSSATRSSAPNSSSPLAYQPTSRGALLRRFDLLALNSAFEFDHVEAAYLVGDEQQAALIFGHIVGPRGGLAGGGLRNEIAAFFRV